MSNAPIKPGGKFFRFRNGTDGLYWKGMSTRTDLGAQPVDRPRLVVNGRYVGGHIVARPPISPTPVASVPGRQGIGVSGVWHPSFLTEHHSYAGLRMWFGAKPADTPGAQVAFFDTDWDLEYKDVATYYHGFYFAPVIERFANFIYVGDHEALRRIYRVDVPAAATTTEYDYDAPADEIVVAFPGFTATALHYHDGRLYFALADLSGTSNGFIYSWDGYQSVLEYSMTTAGATGVAMKSFRNTLVVTVRGLGSILVRSATGSWSTVTVGGFDSSGFMNSMAELKDKLYIVNGGDKVYQYNGTALSLAHTITGGTTPTRANCCVTFNGRLYYLWAESLGSDDYYPWIGVYEPDAVHASYQWKDDYKNFGYADGNVALVDGHDTLGDHPTINKAVPCAMAVYRQRIFVAIEHEVGGTGVVTTEISTHTTENNPYSDWHIIHPNDYVQQPTGPVWIAPFGTRGSIYYLKVI